MNTKYSNIKGYPGYYISKRGTLFTSLKRGKYGTGYYSMDEALIKSKLILRQNLPVPLPMYDAVK